MGQLKNTTSIYLKFGSTKIRIPVNPEEIEIKYPSNNKKQDKVSCQKQYYNLKDIL